MPRPHVALAIAAVLVGGLAIYLFLEVRETPAVASVTRAPDDAATSPVVASKDDSESGKKPRSPWSASMNLPIKKIDTTASDPPPEHGTKPSGMDLVKPSLDGNGDEKANPKGDAIFDEVNRSYDHGDYDDAKAAAIRLLAKDPANVRMIRVVVSSSCILGDNADAQKYYAQLTSPRDRDQMKTRCTRYGVTFTD